VLFSKNGSGIHLFKGIKMHPGSTQTIQFLALTSEFPGVIKIKAHLMFNSIAVKELTVHQNTTAQLYYKYRPKISCSKTMANRKSMLFLTVLAGNLCLVVT